jgi:GMP synthase (glutamine-hydrolysing)
VPPRPLLFLCARTEHDAADDEYAAFLAATGLTPDRLHRLDLVRETLPADAGSRYAGFVAGGSPFNVGDPEEDKSPVQRRVEDDLARVAEAAASGATAAMLTCYGIGVVTRMLGGDVDHAFGEPTGTTAISLTAAGRADPVFGTLPEAFAAFTAHKEGSGAVPAGATLLATADACPVQAYRVGESLWTTQFHPELTPDAFARRIAVYRAHGYFPPSEYDEVVARVRAASVADPARILRAFAELCAV